jgi:predicted lipoprotein with Yx(FWY)xxD motif
MPAKIIHATLTISAVAVLAAGCSSGSGRSSGGGAYGGPGGRPASSAGAGAANAVEIRLSHDRLTAPDGHSLYFNTVDTASKIQCTGSCSSIWPPVTGQAQAGSGLESARFGTAPRPDGTEQVTYYGHPLYEFSGDMTAGTTKGDGIADGGGTWLSATPEVAAAGGPGTSSTGGGASSPGGYGYP